ncbi:hypothetical protein K439DRAFT_643268 [Ramaria rubella]|nr:hypothetical protein K439DRAFT_643268 [Ramaria rubella]
MHAVVRVYRVPPIISGHRQDYHDLSILSHHPVTHGIGSPPDPMCSWLSKLKPLSPSLTSYENLSHSHKSSNTVSSRVLQHRTSSCCSTTASYNPGNLHAPNPSGRARGPQKTVEKESGRRARETPCSICLGSTTGTAPLCWTSGTTQENHRVWIW